MAVSMSWAVLLVAVLEQEPYYFGVYIRAPDFLETPIEGFYVGSSLRGYRLHNRSFDCGSFGMGDERCGEALSLTYGFALGRRTLSGK